MTTPHCEGGDVLVIGRGAVPYRYAGTYHAAGIEFPLPSRYLGIAAERVIAVELPKHRSLHAPDTVSDPHRYRYLLRLPGKWCARMSSAGP